MPRSATTRGCWSLSPDDFDWKLDTLMAWATRIRLVAGFLGGEETRRKMMMKVTCKHEPDFTMAAVVIREADFCDVDIECQRCGEHGYGIVTADSITWHWDDD
jgi:hypothetical protein